MGSMSFYIGEEVWKVSNVKRIIIGLDKRLR
jgi:hypothetical protein